MAHASHSVDYFRIDHSEDHSDMRYNQEPADEDKVQLQILFFGTLPADYTQIEKRKWQQEEYAAEVESNSYYVYPSVPFAIYRQWNEGCREQIQEYSCEIETGDNAADPVEGLESAFNVLVKEDEKLSNRDRFCKNDWNGHEDNQIPWLVVH